MSQAFKRVRNRNGNRPSSVPFSLAHFGFRLWERKCPLRRAEDTKVVLGPSPPAKLQSRALESDPMRSPGGRRGLYQRGLQSPTCLTSQHSCLSCGRSASNPFTPVCRSLVVIPRESKPRCVLDLLSLGKHMPRATPSIPRPEPHHPAGNPGRAFQQAQCCSK